MNVAVGEDWTAESDDERFCSEELDIEEEDDDNDDGKEDGIAEEVMF